MATFLVEKNGRALLPLSLCTSLTAPAGIGIRHSPTPWPNGLIIRFLSTVLLEPPLGILALIQAAEPRMAPSLVTLFVGTRGEPRPWASQGGGQTTNNILTQAGVLFNTKYTWAVYDDPWETGSFVDKADFQRVALHELGHCLGLDHEDDVPAIMGTAVSTGTTIIDPQPDDINGVKAIYGVSGSISESIFVPIVLSVAGLNGSFFSSEMSVSNRGTFSATVEFVYTAAFGQGSGTVTDSLGAGQQRIVKDTIAYLRTLGLAIPTSGSQGGTLRVNFSGLSAVSDGAVSVRTTTIAPGGRAGLAYAGIPISQGLTTPAYISGLRQNGTDRSISGSSKPWEFLGWRYYSAG